MRPVLNLVQTPQAATIKGIFFVFYQGLPARLLWQFNPLPIYKQQQQKKKTEGARAMDRGSWSVTKKKRKKDRRAAEGMLSSHFLPRADTAVFRNDFTGFFLPQWFSAHHLVKQGSRSTHFWDVWRRFFFFFFFNAAQPCQREESGSGTGIQVY